MPAARADMRKEHFIDDSIEPNFTARWRGRPACVEEKR
jgi:hypothetical protein